MLSPNENSPAQTNAPGWLKTHALVILKLYVSGGQLANSGVLLQNQHDFKLC
jgi:hypothetical protein